MGDVVSSILSTARGLPVKIVAVFFDRAPFASHTLKESGIDHLRKLVGKTAAPWRHSTGCVAFVS